MNASRREYSETSCPSSFRRHIPIDRSALILTPFKLGIRHRETPYPPNNRYMVHYFFMPVRANSFRFSYWWYFTV